MSNPNEKLLIAAANGELQNVQQEIKNGANINSTDLNGYAPIHCAVYNNKINVVKYLVEAGANLLMKDTHAYVGFTPLHYASAFGSVDMVKALLLSKVQDIHCKNSTGQSPADVASNSEIKTLLLIDHQTRILKSQQKEQPRQEPVQQVPIQQVPVEEEIHVTEQNSTSCCFAKKKKKLMKVLVAIGLLTLVLLPAIHLFVDANGFPLFIFPCGLIIFLGGLGKIMCKSRKNEKFREMRGLIIHKWSFLVANIVNYITSQHTYDYYWFYFFIITLIPLSIHVVMNKSKKNANINKKLAIHGIFYLAFILTSYVTYCLINTWRKNFLEAIMWSIPSGIWSAIFGLHVYLTRKNRCKINISLNEKDVENQFSSL